MLEFSEIDAPPFEADAFGFQQEALLHRGFSAKGDAASGTENALPGQSADQVQDPADMARAAWIAGGLRNRTIGADATAGDLADGGGDSGFQWGHGVEPSAVGNQQSATELRLS